MLTWQKNLVDSKSCTCMMTPRFLMQSALFRLAHSSSLLPAQPSYNALQHRHPKSSVAWLATIQVSPSKQLNISCSVRSRWSDIERLIWPGTQLIIPSSSRVPHSSRCLDSWLGDRPLLGAEVQASKKLHSGSHDMRWERSTNDVAPPWRAPGRGLGAHGELDGADELLHGGHAPRPQLAVHLRSATRLTLRHADITRTAGS